MCHSWSFLLAVKLASSRKTNRVSLLCNHARHFSHSYLHEDTYLWRLNSAFRCSGGPSNPGFVGGHGLISRMQPVMDANLMHRLFNCVFRVLHCHIRQEKSLNQRFEFVDHENLPNGILFGVQILNNER